MAATSQLLCNYRAKDVRFHAELRPPSYAGPQLACHLDEVELCLVQQGAERVAQGRHRSVIGAGQYSLVAVGREHSSWTTEVEVRESILHVREERLLELADSAGLRLPAGLPPEPFDAPPDLVCTLSMLERELRSEDPQPGHALLVDSLVTALWVPLLRRHGQERGPAPVAMDPTGGDRRLRRVEECLRADLSVPHTLDDLAQLAGLSRFHLLRAFKQRYGLPPYAYLTRLRVERAAALARETDLPLTTIALDVGFGSSSRLTEAFRSHYGQNPAQWRREQRPSAISGST